MNSALWLLFACLATAFTLDGTNIYADEAYEIMHSGYRFDEIPHLRIHSPVPRAHLEEFRALMLAPQVDYSEDYLSALRSSWNQVLPQDATRGTSRRCDKAIRFLRQQAHAITVARQAPQTADGSRDTWFPSLHALPGTETRRSVSINVLGEEESLVLYDIQQLLDEGENYLVYGLLDLGPRCLNIWMFLASQAYDRYNQESQ